MTTRSGSMRLATRAPKAVRLHVAAAGTVLVIAAAAIAGLWSVPIAMLAAGAGAGYSLSGSV